MDSVSSFLYRLYGVVYSFLYSFYRGLGVDRFVVGSGLSPSLERYVSIVFKIIICILVSMILIVSIFLYSAYGLNPYLSIAISFVFNLFVVLPISIVFSIVLPKSMYSNRGSIVESKMPILLSAMAFLSSAGLSLHEMVSKIGMFLGDDYRFFSVELDIVRSYIRIGVPLEEALRYVAHLTPSQSFRELLLGLSSISVIGGDIGSFIRSMFDRYVSRYELMIEKAVNSLNVYMEVYVAVSLLIPVLAGSTAVLFILSPIAGISFEAFMALVTFILIPIPSAVIIVLADTIVSRLRP
ncbi:MAG: type II secretion system F family protein [Ignisphaera sp.]